MRRTHHDHRRPFDHEAEAIDDDADVTQQFWGTSRGWSGRDRPLESTSGDDTTGAIRAIREGVAAFRPRRVDLRDSTGQVRRTRTHGMGRDQSAPSRADRRATATIGELASGHFDEPVEDGVDEPFPDRPTEQVAAASPAASGDDWLDDDWPDDDWPDDHDLVPLTADEPARSTLGLGAVDPLLLRLGALVLVGVLLVPVALALRPSEPADDTVRIESPTPTEAVADPQAAPAGGAAGSSAAPAAADAASDSADSSAGDTSTAPAATAETDAAPVVDVSAATPAADAEGASSANTASGDDATAPDIETSATPEAATNDGGIDDAATADEPAERVVPECPQTYTAGAGDSWYRIADAAGVSPDAVMAENLATGDTVILPGDEICLPADATIPSPPPAPEPDTTDAPITTGAPTTTAPPATTQPPTTTAAPAPPASVDEVKALIRTTWPEDEHETALRIADRESRFNPRADNNWCCYGVFQIYFTVHQSWLDDFGVHQASDLFDAEKNIAAAYHLYQQSGGWGPWGF